VARILFVCTFNAVRSPIAAALMKRQLGLPHEVESAGIFSDAVDPFAVATMAELGIDLGDHEGRALDELDPAAYSVAIALSPEAHRALPRWIGAADCAVEFWPVADPAAREGNRDERIAAYRMMRDDLLRRIRRRFERGEEGRAAPEGA
jgi:protein-tyrosine-phosphatase